MRRTLRAIARARACWRGARVGGISMSRSAQTMQTQESHGRSATMTRTDRTLENGTVRCHAKRPTPLRREMRFRFGAISMLCRTKRLRTPTPPNSAPKTTLMCASHRLESSAEVAMPRWSRPSDPKKATAVQLGGERRITSSACESSSSCARSDEGADMKGLLATARGSPGEMVAHAEETDNAKMRGWAAVVAPDAPIRVESGVGKRLQLARRSRQSRAGFPEGFHLSRAYTGKRVCPCRPDGISGGELGQFLADGVHQGAEGFFGEVEDDAGGGEELGERAGAAEFQGGAVVGDRAVGVVAGFDPELEGAELGDAVFDVVEGDVEEVELGAPERLAVVLDAAPILLALEAVGEAKPFGLALRARVAGVGVDPVLERVDGGHPREEADDLLELGSARAGDIGGVFVEDLEVVGAQQFHRHAGDFAELHGRRAEEHQRLVAGGQAVEGVAALVQEGLDVALGAGGVHEDEGLAGLFEAGLVAAGLLALSAGEVEVLAAGEGLEVLGQRGGDALEDGASLRDQQGGLIAAEGRE